MVGQLSMACTHLHALHNRWVLQQVVDGGPPMHVVRQHRAHKQTQLRAVRLLRHSIRRQMQVNQSSVTGSSGSFSLRQHGPPSKQGPRILALRIQDLIAGAPHVKVGSHMQHQLLLKHYASCGMNANLLLNLPVPSFSRTLQAYVQNM